MLVAKNITKKFPGVTALDNINMELHPGKVNAIIGENGAGKSTLMKIFSGVHTEYGGEIILNDKPVHFSSTKDAEAAGIAIIHQELNLVPYLNITENIFLGSELVNAWGVLDKKKMQEKTRQLLKRLNLDISPDAKISSLKVGQQQLIEIAKALHVNVAIIIMDEPTSAISDKEVENLFSIIAELKSQGKTIAYISHKLNELFQIADRFIVMRDGATVNSGEMKGTNQEELIQMMTGRKILIQRNETASERNGELLQLKNICLKNAANHSADILHNISLTLHSGEIIGIYGLMGAGRTELMETIFGLYPKLSSGEIKINGRKLKLQSASDAINAGIVLVPEDRKLQGLSISQSVRPNMSITILKQLERWGIMLNRKKEMELSKQYIRQLAIKTSSTETIVKNLSGGNQQKIVLAKWLAKNPKVLLLDEPTRGIDINAKSEIYKLIKQLAVEGMGIVMVTSELPEILAVSDRVLVMCEGELTANIPIAEATEATILKYAIHKN
ncbi:MAG TPA: sugar ABC transporter ATP-binding protein [Chitinophagaceae bacterium]|nr:sugar ABC transporter ATP-binding protein [Chitinophagaceae bacterium]